MRATRAFVGAFGAGISLAIASSLMLFVVSSVIAFNGWPDDLNGTSEPEIAALSEPTERKDGTIRATVAVALPPAAAVPAAGKAKPDGRGAPGVAGHTQDNIPTTADTTDSSGPGPSTDPTDDPSSPDSSAPALPAKTDPIGQVGEVVRDTTGGVADVVEPVSPAVSGALQSVGAAGSDTVDQVGQTVDKVAGAVLNP